MVTMKSLLALSGALSLAAAANCPVADTSVIAHTGTPVGKEIVYNGSTLYVSLPKSCPDAKAATPKAVLYLTDVFGIQLKENKLLADSFARAGFYVVAPDMFDGAPAPTDLNTPGFNVTDFTMKHQVANTDPIVEKAVAYIQNELKIKNIGATGYCFGGRYAFRFGAPGRGATAVFTAHPSLQEDAEVLAVKAPTSVAAAETDQLMSDDKRHQLEGFLKQNKNPYSVALYSGTNHGFGVRANVSNPQEKFGKEEAFFQAVRWFDVWA